LTQTGRFVGTLDYVAPEQISGETVDARADVYALGCLLFKLLSGEVPFPRDGEAARLFAHLNDPPPAPSLYAPEISTALDDVVVRAMSKSPYDRYPSAGDLGRAAQAALRGEQPTLPERTVATGAAATRTTETIALGDEKQPSAGARTDGRRRLAIGGGVLALLAIVAAVALASGGGETDSGGGGGEGDSSTAKPTTTPEQKSKPEPKPNALTQAELVASADAICEDSQRGYLEIRDLESERSADIPYAEALARLAAARVQGLRRLTPPQRVAGAYEEYVEAQERVFATDKQALAAARNGDAAVVEAARDKRDAEQAERYELARAIGLRKCSASR
ncbi:MAG TPA: hypothetical protein VN752_04850, partial [Solirubrobacterales bacterium]|nr:hypothetical protein [Solirubrobacterales bacterium]